MKNEISGQDLWQRYRRKGYEAVKTAKPHSTFESFYLASIAFGEGDMSVAVECARMAANKAPQSAVFRHAVTYLERVLLDGKLHVYVDGEAFAAFIRGGGNRFLYEKTSAVLYAAYEEYEGLSVLDVGVGDGLALLPALHENIRSLHLLEPSAAMLQKVCHALDQRGHPSYQTIHSSLQDFMMTCSGEWDLIESTFCLHSIPPEERREALAWMRAHGKRVLLAEFDVPNFPEMYEPERVKFFLERYEQGLAEYADDEGFVAQGFLMPILFGNFDRTQARSTYEQPIKEWREDLIFAGFRSIKALELYSYWWSTAYLLDAS